MQISKRIAPKLKVKALELQNSLNNVNTIPARKNLQFFKSKNNQRNFLLHLYNKFQFTSLEDWVKVNKSFLITNGGKQLFAYAENLQALLQTLYPNFPWEFDNNKERNSNDYFSSISNQKRFMDQLYKELNLQSLDDWLDVPKQILIENGGRSLLLYYYGGDMNKILLTLYPNHNWSFKKKLHEDFSLSSQQEFIEKLYEKLKFNSLDDWKNVSKKRIFKFKGGHYLEMIYKGDVQGIFQTIYPNYPWEFNKLSKLTKKLYFNSIENQRQFMDDLYQKLQLKSLSDWKNVAKLTFINNGGRLLLFKYSEDLTKMIENIYPNYPWEKINLYTKLNENNFKLIENQIEFMNNLFIKWNLKTLNDWLLVPRTKLKKSGGNLLIFYYENNKEKLLSTIYPNYPWEFDDINIRKGLIYFRSIENQIKFMDGVYNKLHMKSLADWITVKRGIIKNNFGKSLFKLYKYNYHQILQTIYPNYPWPKEERVNKFKGKKTVKLYQKTLDNLFVKLKLKSMEDWKLLSNTFIQQNGGDKILRYYKGDIMKMLTSIYPDYQWGDNYKNNNNNNDDDENKININKIKGIDNSKKLNVFHVIEYQRNFMEKLFYDLKLNSLEDFLQITRFKLCGNGGRPILFFYHNNLQKLLSSIFPNYPWNFEDIYQRRLLNEYLSIDNQRELMDQLYYKLELISFDDWEKIGVTTIKIKGGDLILRLYSRNLSKLFQSIYPNFPWKIEEKIPAKIYYQSIDNQREFMDDLFVKLKLNCLDDWLNVKKVTITSHGGNSIIKHYEYNYKELLMNIYPHYKWEFDNLNFDYNEYFKSLDNQQKCVKELYRKLKLQSITDWINVRKYQVIKVGGKSILKYYHYDLLKLLSAIYPSIDWYSLKSNLKFQLKRNLKSFQIYEEKLKTLLRTFEIREKKDWYRIPLDYKHINVYHTLKKNYPREDWNLNLFTFRAKKSTQRLLFIFIRNLYSNLYVIENYRHPHIQSVRYLEFDIFIPSFNWAFEYQGAQHYNDIPRAFSQLDLYQFRDTSKVSVSSKKSIQLIIIPYWWDGSLSSLVSTLRKNI